MVNILADGILAVVWQPVLWKENSKFKSALHSLKIDLLSHPSFDRRFG